MIVTAQPIICHPHWQKEEEKNKPMYDQRLIQQPEVTEMIPSYIFRIINISFYYPP